LAVAASVRIAGQGWEAELDEVFGRIGGVFARVETRRTARRMVGGLVAPLPTKNCWSLAEHVGDRSPDAMQHLLARARWDHDQALTEVRDYGVEQLGYRDGIGVLDETGDLTKGAHTVGAGANTPAPPDGSRIRRSRCSCPMAPTAATP
jgi:SRSO17 transposase